MGKRNRGWILAGWIISACLVGCGGGGFAGIDGSGAKPELSATGPINGFGSVIVNGVHYNTDNARVLVRGELADEVDLNVGDYVTVVGGTNDQGEAIAYEVHYQPRVTGEIQWVDQERSQFGVLGQVVQLQEDTIYDSDLMPRNIDALETGMRVSVSGPMDADYQIRATRVSLDESLFYELLGLVEELDPYTRQFVVNGQAVSYSKAQSSSQLVNGKLVVVRGELDGDVLVADEMSFTQDYRQLRGIAAVELSGYVKNLQSSEQFSLDSVPVMVNSVTRFIGGDKADLKNNFKVRVVGALNSADVLVATDLEFLAAPDTQVFGEIQSVYPIFGVPGSWGKIKVQDQDFLVMADTTLTGEFERRIGFYDLLIGDRVYVSGYSRNGQYIATSVAVDNRDIYSVEIQGVAYMVSVPLKAFSIFATRVVVGPETTFSQTWIPLTETELFKKLPNQYVRVRGHYEKGFLVARQVQLMFMDYYAPGWYSVPTYYQSPSPAQ
jgi:hypothetical protein